jgi:hypothetical protein
MKYRLLVFTALADARFTIEYPGTRGLNDTKQTTWPCGSFNDAFISSRSAFPIAGGPVQISTTTGESLLQVVMALGSEPGLNFNITVVPTFYQFGTGDYCIGSAVPPVELGLAVGNNATLQVISAGEVEGDLYSGCLSSVDFSWSLKFR